jgi:hypothetical protein
MATIVPSGPFVNEQGQLDLTLAREEDSMFYEIHTSHVLKSPQKA